MPKPRLTSEFVLTEFIVQVIAPMNINSNALVTLANKTPQMRVKLRDCLKGVLQKGCYLKVVERV